jgi:hypothetical protein
VVVDPARQARCPPYQSRENPTATHDHIKFKEQLVARPRVELEAVDYESTVLPVTLPRNMVYKCRELLSILPLLHQVFVEGGFEFGEAGVDIRDAKARLLQP